jgi:hypothetical protein
LDHLVALRAVEVVVLGETSDSFISEATYVDLVEAIGGLDEGNVACFPIDVVINSLAAEFALRFFSIFLQLLVVSFSIESQILITSIYISNIATKWLGLNLATKGLGVYLAIANIFIFILFFNQTWNLIRIYFLIIHLTV